MENSIWIKLYPEKQTIMLRELSFTYREIEKRSQALVIKYALLLFLVPILFILLPQKWIALSPLALVLLFYTTDKLKVTKVYDNFNDKRHFEFLYFFQLLVPHLKQATSSRIGLFNVLTKMETRLPSEEDDEDGGILKQGVNQLLIGITNRPADIEVFKDFARTCSGTDMAEDVCVALYDWQQNSADIKQLDRLKVMVNHALTLRVGEIAESKLSKFEWYSARTLLITVVMSIVILIGVTVLQGFEIFKAVRF